MTTSGANNWLVYIILCSDNTLYTGITNDLERRLVQHATQKGAKYFRGRQPIEVVYLENNHTRSSAGKRECFIKLLTRTQKLQLIPLEINVVGCPKLIVKYVG